MLSEKPAAGAVMALFYLIAAVCALLLIMSASGQSAIGCKNANGHPVDWWTAIKTPAGAEYIYIDADATEYNFEYTEGNDLSAVSGNPLGETVGQIYTAGVGYVIWNDEPASGHKDPPLKSLHAHSKGVLGFQSDGGFYVLHSTPKFPTDPAKDAYGGISDCSYNKQGVQTTCDNEHGQFKYAQSYLCVTLDAANLNIVAGVLRGDTLVQYGQSLGRVGSNVMPNVTKLVRQDASGTPAKVFGEPFQTVGGEAFLLFGMAATTPDNPVYLYEELIEPTLGAGLKVQTWTEVYRFDSYCPGGCEPEGHPDFMETLNVEHISVPGTSLSWSTKKKDSKNAPGKGQEDHSKWAVTIPSTSNTVNVEVLCISDINRADHQLERGGGAACFIHNPGMWELWDSLVGDDVEPCLATCPHDNPPHVPARFTHASDYEDDDGLPERPKRRASSSSPGPGRRRRVTHRKPPRQHKRKPERDEF